MKVNRDIIFEGEREKMKKMRFKKRIYAFVLMLVMVVSMLPVSPSLVKAESPEMDGSNTYVRVHFFNEFDWATPAIQVWGGNKTIVEGDGDAYHYDRWNADITNLVKESDTKWCSAVVRGDFTGFQFLNPADGEGFDNLSNDIIKSCTGSKITDLYLKRNAETNWKPEWYLDADWTVSIDTLIPAENDSRVIINGDKYPLNYAGQGTYEAFVDLKAGEYTPSLVVYGIETEGKAISLSKDSTVVIRATIEGSTITVSDSVNDVIDSYVAVAGDFGSLGLAGDEVVPSWDPSAAEGLMVYAGNGKFVKTMHFAALSEAKTVEYKVTFNKSWDGALGNNGANIYVTVPAGATELAITYDKFTGKTYNSVNGSDDADYNVSLIGTVRKNDDWKADATGYEFQQIGEKLFVRQEVLEKGSYQYKYIINYSEWKADPNVSLTIDEKQVVLFVFNSETKEIIDSVNNPAEVVAAVGDYKVALNKKIYVKVPENFGKVFIHYWVDGANDSSVWPGDEITVTDAKTGWLLAEIPVKYDRFIINNKEDGEHGVQSKNIETVGDKSFYVFGEEAATAYNPDDFMTVHIKTEYEETAVYEFEGYEVKGWPGTVLADADEDGWYTVLLDIRSSKFIVNNNNKGSQTANLIRADYAEKTWIYVNEDNEVAAFATKDAAEDAIEAAKAPADPSQPVEKTTFTVHVKAPSDWEKVQAYICTSSWGELYGKFDNAPEMTKGADGWYTIEVKIKKAPYYYIFHNGKGTQTADLVYAGTEDVWFDITKKGDNGKYIGTPLNTNPDELSEAEKAEAEKQAAEETKRREEEEKRKQEAAMKEQLKDSYIIYVQVPSSWTKACYYTWEEVAPDYPRLQPWPGTTLKDKDGSWYKAYIPKNMNRIIFNDGKADGAVKTDNITISGTEYFVVNEAGKYERFATKPSTEDIQKAEEAAANRLKDTYNVYVKVDASWTDACYYAWVKEPFEDLAKWPGTKLPTEMKDGYHVVKVPKFMDWIIINNGKADGAVQTKDIETFGKDCYITVNADGSYEVIDASGNKIDGEEPAKVVEGVEKVTLYVKVPADWATPRLWAWGSEGNLYDAWPGEALVQEGEWLVATLPTWVNYLIINGNDGSVQTADIKLAEIGRDIYLTVISADEYTIEYKDVEVRNDVIPEVTSPKDEKTEDDSKTEDKNSEAEEGGAIVADTTEDGGSFLSPQSIMLIITAAVILLGGVVVIVVLSRKKAFDTKE